MTVVKAALIGATLTLAACGGSPDRFAVVPPVATETVRIGFRSVEVRDVSLPTYAAADEISLQDADGRLVTEGDMLWADSPERAVALEITRHLTQLTGARVASDPWPFEGFPDARLEVRFESLIAGTDGQFRTTGQYFVAVANGRERAGLFALAAPFDPEGGLPAIAQARGQIILQLATDIARNGLR